MTQVKGSERLRSEWPERARKAGMLIFLGRFMPLVIFSTGKMEITMILLTSTLVKWAGRRFGLLMIRNIRIRYDGN